MLLVVRFPNGRFMKHGCVFVPKDWSSTDYEDTSDFHVEIWKAQMTTHTTEDVNEARTFDNEKSANLAVKRAGYTDFEILEVELTLK
jgi:hypothetical protein